LPIDAICGTPPPMSNSARNSGWSFGRSFAGN